MKPNGGGDKIPSKLKAKIDSDLGGVAKMKEDFTAAGVTQFGSGGLTRRQATGNFIGGLAAVAPQAESRGVKVLVEALPVAQSDVVQTLAEAVAIVEEIGSPAIRTMFDVHNAIDERSEERRVGKEGE